jgi:FkbM family methyltransferase
MVQSMAKHNWSRKALNTLYLELTYPQWHSFHHQFAKIFFGEQMRASNGAWEVEFAERRIRLPVTRERLWLDWACALSAVGHEVEVKETYSSLITSQHPPQLFLDIGANYGTHSILFLAHGIDTITFEPNSSCHGYFRDVCVLNNLRPRLEAVALGDDDDYVNLSYPERDTWLGSTDEGVIEKLVATQRLITERVEQRKLDDYFDELGTRRVLMKVDTEGNECKVLEGSRRILREKRPLIIVECWGGVARAKLFDFLDAQKYTLAQLPWKPNKPTPPLRRSEFADSAGLNYMAVPVEQSGGLMPEVHIR